MGILSREATRKIVFLLFFFFCFTFDKGYSKRKEFAHQGEDVGVGCVCERWGGGGGGGGGG